MALSLAQKEKFGRTVLKKGCRDPCQNHCGTDPWHLVVLRGDAEASALAGGCQAELWAQLANALSPYNCAVGGRDAARFCATLRALPRFQGLPSFRPTTPSQPRNARADDWHGGSSRRRARREDSRSISGTLRVWAGPRGPQRRWRGKIAECPGAHDAQTLRKINQRFKGAEYASMASGGSRPEGNCTRAIWSAARTAGARCNEAVH